MSDTGAMSKVTGWLAVVSTVVTVTLTVLNAHWSREADEKAQALNEQLQQREQELKLQQLQLDAGKDKLARYSFVQNLFSGVLGQNPAQKNLTVNLIALALTPDEAQKLFSGLEGSENQAAKEVGSLGNTVALSSLILQMNDAVKENRIGAVDQLIKNYRTNSAAVDQAIKLIEQPQLATLNASGRINVLFFLRSTDPSAWSEESIDRTEKAIADIRSRSKSGIEIGEQTDDALSKLSAFVKSIRG